MTGCRRFLHVLLAWLAIVAYVTPVAAHNAPSVHTHAGASAGHSCGGHDDHDTSKHSSIAMPELTADTQGTCGDHKTGPVACCVAMCAPALPSPALIALWTSALHATSDGPVAHAIVVAFVTRLDRPPKSGVAPIG